MDSLLDNRALKLREDAEHAEHRFSRRRAGIERLSVQIQITPGSLHFIERVQQVLQASTQPVPPITPSGCRNAAAWPDEVPCPALGVRPQGIGGRMMGGP